MAVLLVALAVMLTLMTMAMPVWRQQARREREEELLFRLKQYAHALVLYQRRLPGAAPNDLDDLVKQRFLRKKYKDPMTGKDFALLRVGQVSPGMTTPLPGQRVPSTPGGFGGGMTGPSGSRTPSSSTFQQPGSSSSRPGGVGSTTVTGPIRGVVSTSKETSLRVWKGRTQYDQWEVAMEDITPRYFGQQTPQPGQPNQRGPGSQGPGQGGSRSPGSTMPTQSPPNPYGGTIRR